jgi:uncharacterized lipoprotein YbaY
VCLEKNKSILTYADLSDIGKLFFLNIQVSEIEMDPDSKDHLLRVIFTL